MKMTKKSCKNNSIIRDVLSEEKLVCSVIDYFAEKGYRVRREISNMGQSIDIVATKNNCITAIEVKRSNWRRALEQCKAHELVADYIILALSIKKIPPELKNYTEKKGWGLLIYESEKNLWKMNFTPKKNDNFWMPQRIHFSNDLMKVDYVA